MQDQGSRVKLITNYKSKHSSHVYIQIKYNQERPQDNPFVPSNIQLSTSRLEILAISFSP